jgi:hypothetical protein
MHTHTPHCKNRVRQGSYNGQLNQVAKEVQYCNGVRILGLELDVGGPDQKEGIQMAKHQRELRRN